MLLWRNSPTRARAATFFIFLDHTEWRTIADMTPLNEGSARRRDFCLATHNNQNKQTPVPPDAIRTRNPSTRSTAQEEGSRFLQNVGNVLPIDTASHPMIFQCFLCARSVELCQVKCSSVRPILFLQIGTSQNNGKSNEKCFCWWENLEKTAGVYLESQEFGCQRMKRDYF